MVYIFSALLIVVLIALVLWIFVNSEPAMIAMSMRLVVPVTMISVGTIATIAGRGQYGIPAIVIGLLWWYTNRKRV